MKCPLCGKEIKEGASVCIHCKGKFIECPYCKEIIDGNIDVCNFCDSIINENQQSNETAGSNNIIILSLEQELAFKQRKKKIVIAFILNFVLAGTGLLYVNKFGLGVVFIILSLISYIFSIELPSVLTVNFILFIISLILSHHKIELYNQELKIELSKK